MIKHPPRLYTDRHWAEADTIERIRIYLIEPTRWVLTDMESDRLQSLRQVWAICTENRVPRERIKLICEAIQVSERTVRRYIDDAQLLFGDLLAVNHLIELQAAYNRILEIEEKAFGKDDYETAAKCVRIAADLLEKIQAAQPPEKIEYQAYLFTSDEQFIRRLGQEDTYADYVEISE